MAIYNTILQHALRHAPGQSDDLYALSGHGSSARAECAPRFAASLPASLTLSGKAAARLLLFAVK